MVHIYSCSGSTSVCYEPEGSTEQEKLCNETEFASGIDHEDFKERRSL